MVPFARRSAPILAVALASLLLGAALTVGCWTLGGGVGVPQTHFTDGHVIGTALGADMLLDGDAASLWTDRAAWPGGARLRPLLWPVVAISVVTGPAIALTLAWALTPLLGVLGGAALAASLGARPWGAALTGGLLAWAPWVRTTLANGQVEQAGLGAIAATWAAAIAGERGGRWRVLCAPALLLGVGLAAPHLALAAGVGLGLVAALRVATLRSRAPRHAVILALGLAAVGTAGAYHGAGFEPGADVFRPRERGPERSGTGARPATPAAGWHAVDTAQLEAATPTALLVPTGPGAFEMPAQHSPFLGYTLLLAAALAAGARPRAALPWVGVGAGFCVLAMGARVPLSPTHFLPLPWAVVEAVAPDVARSGSTYRLATGAIVALAAAAGLAWPASGGGGRMAGWRGAAIAAGLITLAWLETTALPGHALPYAAQVAGGHRGLTALPPGAQPVLDLPLPLHRGCETQRAHYLSGAALHHRPALHTTDVQPELRDYGRHRGPALDLERTLSGPGCPDALAPRLAALGVGAIVGHLDPACPLPERFDACLQAALGPPDHADDEVRIWRVD